MAKTKISVKTKRVYEVAHEFNLSSVAMVEQIRSLGFEVKNHMAICTTPMIEAVREKFDLERQATRQKPRRTQKKERDILEQTPRVSPRRGKRLLSSKDALDFRLFILKEARKNLVQDFIKKNREIYIPMFKYEESDVLMELAREKYIVSWLDSQWNLLENLFQNQEIEATVRNELRYSFAEVFLRLIKNFNTDGASSFSIRLIKEKIKYLEKLLNSGDKFEDGFNGLVDYERDKRLFQRKINELKGK